MTEIAGLRSIDGPNGPFGCTLCEKKTPATGDLRIDLLSQDDDLVGVRKRPFRIPGRIQEHDAVFRADHPFLFFIRYDRSNTCLFAGRVAYPNTLIPRMCDSTLFL